MKTPALLIAAALAVQMSGRVITPNGDGINDFVTFTVPATPDQPRATVFDRLGRRVAQLTPSTSQHWIWNGHNDAGQVVASGIYIVQIVSTAGLWNGVLTVAR